MNLASEPASPVISVDEALSIVRAHAQPLAPAESRLEAAAGLILAADLLVPQDVPPFDQSAMDGYALRFEDLSGGMPLRVTGLAAAGQAFAGIVESGTAVRIFTGAPVPNGADTVVMQEHVRLHGTLLHVETAPAKRGDNIRPAGAQSRRGEVAMLTGSRLSPGAIGFLASLGISRFPVYPRPRIGILVTGKELVPAGQPLPPAGIHESNSLALSAALHDVGLVPAVCRRVDDDEDLITEELQACLSECDIVLTTGGVSVGDHDYVRSAASRCGVETLIYKIRQRPGKPMYFGKAGNTLVFGLPGNPASALTAFYVYVIPAIQALGGLPGTTGLPRIRRKLGGDAVKKEGLTFFLRACLQGDAVAALPDQASFMMNSFAGADCLIVLDEARAHYPAGELVDVLVLPHAFLPTYPLDVTRG